MVGDSTGIVNSPSLPLFFQGEEWSAPELPLVALGERLVRPSARVAIEDLP